MIAINPWLYIGAYRDTINRDALQHAGIDSMLQLAAPVEHPGIESLYLPVEDGKPLPHHLLEHGVDFIVAQHRANRRILVACGAGISRSATFCVAGLHAIDGTRLLDAYQLVHAQHAEAMPNPYLWQSLLAYHGEDVPLVEAMEQVLGVYRAAE